MSHVWKNKKVNCIGKYNIYSINGKDSSNDSPRKWYLEVYMQSRHGELYRNSYGSDVPFRLLAVWQSLIRYKLEK